MYMFVAVPISYVFSPEVNFVEVGVIPEIESLLYVSKVREGDPDILGHGLDELFGFISDIVLPLEPCNNLRSSSDCF